ncbi:MAG TPA: FliH/SctL family protein [Rubrivivax sp.]|nr:FliH/SctL family protein [Rubrivivax sp.]
MSGTPKSPLRNVPPPPARSGAGPGGPASQGSQGGSSKPAGPYARFIPREELGAVASWRPGTFGAGTSAPTSDAAAAGGVGADDATAEALRARLDAERSAMRQAGYQEGYRDGLAALENFKQHFAAQATAQIGQLLDSLDAQWGALDARVAQTLVHCAVQLAQQVVRSELAVRPELVVRVAADALDAVMLSARHIRVYAHPDDLPLIAEGADDALRARGARLLADETLERGGVRVDSDAGTLDARIATRWAQAAAALGSELGWSAESGS